MAQQIQFPKKEQAIVTDAIEGLQIKDYVVSIGKLIGPENIRFASRISQSRVCLYLSTQEIVNKVTEMKISIGSHTLAIRPLISKHKRIIISNVCPIIPHTVIEAKLREHNVNPVSQITFIRAGMNEAEYSHIMSFRRQVYVNPEDEGKLPESLQIHYEGTSYWVYITGEKLSCFLCKEEGHLAKYCKNTELENSMTQSLLTNEDSNITDKTPDPTVPLVLTQQSVNSNVLNITGIKRHRSVISSSNESNTEVLNVDEGNRRLTSGIQQKNQKWKKDKTQNKRQCTQAEIDEQLKPAKEHLVQNSTIYPINYDDLSVFLKDTFGSKEIPAIANKYTTDTTALITMLNDTVHEISDKTLQARIRRIVKRLTDGYETSSTEEL